MLRYLKNKLKPDIIFHCLEPGIQELSPIQRASNYSPDWWQKINYETNTKIVDNGVYLEGGSIKKCPGVIEFLRTGFILPLWTDIQVVVDSNDNVITRVSNNSYITSFPNDDQLINHLPANIKNNYFKVLKIQTPWISETKKDIKILFLNPFFHFNEYFDVIPGIKNHSSIHINIFLLLKKKGNFVIERGTPLCLLFPYKSHRISHSVKSVDFSKTEKLISGIHNINRSKFSSAENYRKITSTGKCPYHNLFDKFL